MFGYNINKLNETEFKKYKEIAEKYADFRWNWNHFGPKDFKCSSDGYWRGLELEEVCKELDRLQFKYNVLLSLSKYYNPTIEEDVKKQIKDLQKVKCKEC